MEGGVYYDGVTKGRRGLVLFVRKLGHKIPTNGTILTELLLKPLRVPLKVLEQPVVCGHE
jgi:hypothetical protein